MCAGQLTSTDSVFFHLYSCKSWEIICETRNLVGSEKERRGEGDILTSIYTWDVAHGEWLRYIYIYIYIYIAIVCSSRWKSRFSQCPLQEKWVSASWWNAPLDLYRISYHKKAFLRGFRVRNICLTLYELQLKQGLRSKMICHNTDET